ncbi:hypothetical protein ACFLVO_03460, partial [Chloroflexota bacterium]
RYNVWLVSLLILAVLGASLGLAIWQHGDSLSSGVVTKSYSEPLGDIERAQIEIDFSAGSINVGSLPPGSPNFVEAESEIRNGRSAMNVDFHQQDSVGNLYLSTTDYQFQGGAGIRWEVRFTRNIPLAIDAKAAAGNMELDLRELEVTELRLDVDAGNCRVTVPSSAGTSNIEVEVDAANIEIIVPDEVAAKIRMDTTLCVSDVDMNRFPQQGAYYVSENFDTAQNQIYLTVNCDIGRVQVR